MLIGLLGIFLLGLSCDSHAPEVPKDLLTEAEMVDFITDLTILNASRGYRNLDGITYVRMPDTLFYAHHGIDSLQFAQSHEYYASNPKKYIKILEAVGVQIESMKDSIKLVMDAEQKNKSARKDTVRSKNLSRKQD